MVKLGVHGGIEGVSLSWKHPFTQGIGRKAWAEAHHSWSLVKLQLSPECHSLYYFMKWNLFTLSPAFSQTEEGLQTVKGSDRKS